MGKVQPLSQIFPTTYFHTFYWQLLHLHVVYGFFVATVAELNSCDRDCVTYEA